jgi:uncharacterized damage-inducible protein DinB
VPVSISELLIPEFDQEMPVTRRVLERVPDARGEWKPHDKSFPMAHLAQLVARMPAWFSMIAKQHEIDFAPKDGSRMPGYSIETTATLLAEFDRNVSAAREAVAAVSDERFQDPWTLKRAEQVLQQMSRYQMMRSTFNHLVHHRAQLGIYLRLSDVKVPSMYGPTADEGW